MEPLNDERRQSSREKPREKSATREFRRILQESGAKIRQGEGGPGVHTLSFLTPFQAEAEAEFQRLKELVRIPTTGREPALGTNRKVNVR